MQLPSRPSQRLHQIFLLNCPHSQLLNVVPQALPSFLSTLFAPLLCARCLQDDGVELRGHLIGSQVHGTSGTRALGSPGCSTFTPLVRLCITSDLPRPCWRCLAY